MTWYVKNVDCIVITMFDIHFFLNIKEDNHNTYNHNKDDHNKDNHGKDNQDKDNYGKDNHSQDGHGQDNPGKDNNKVYILILKQKTLVFRLGIYFPTFIIGVPFQVSDQGRTHRRPKCLASMLMNSSLKSVRRNILGFKYFLYNSWPTDVI